MIVRSVLAIAILVGACAGEVLAQTSRARPLTLQTILAIEDSRAPTQADLDVLLAALRSPLADRAIVSLGRLERRELVTDLLPFLTSDKTRDSAATALAMSMRGAPLDAVTLGQQENVVLTALIAAGDTQLRVPRPVGLTSIARAIGRLPYVDAADFRTAETFLRRVLDRPFPQVDDEPHVAAARGLESLVRLNRKLGTLDEETIGRLQVLARSASQKRTVQQLNALAALVATQGVDAMTLDVVLDSPSMEVRRLATVALTGSGSVVDGDERLDHIRDALSDTSFAVRLEGVRAWARRGAAEHGCQPLVDALADRNLHVVLTALDALGDVCKDDRAITDLLSSEARTPPTQGRWQREAHALVSLAKRNPARASSALGAFAMHQTWQVRMYAARTAATLNDKDALVRLAGDPDANVAETALVPLRRLMGPDSDAQFVAALNRRSSMATFKSVARPYQLLRTAAIALENADSTPALVTALVGALERTTADRCETSRDTRLALIARLAQLGSPAQLSALTPLLKDFDPRVAGAAAAVISQWTAQTVEAEPMAYKPAGAVNEGDLARPVRVSFQMDSGQRFDVMFEPLSAPLTRARFLNAVRAGYYNNLTFHRVVPNFVIQGGSPGANEYCGDCPFMRDEVGGMHERGTLGISTRGRDTGDAQIFVNLVDNARLDYDYTVFARVCSGQNVVDDIHEGDRIARVQVLPANEACGTPPRK